MKNRLLSEQEIISILSWPTMLDYELHQATAAAQLAKADKEWVEWVVVEAAVIRLGDEQGELANGDYIAIPAKRWQSRRKEIGL